MNDSHPALTDIHAVLLAGGKGTRLQPYTTVLPKPLLPIGETPILQIVLETLNRAGFRKATISVGHQAELIQAFFSRQKNLQMAIDFAVEDKPLGTIGPLWLIPDLGEHFLVMNGDILTDLNLTAMWQAHLKSDAVLTVATFERKVSIDFGVLRFDPSSHQIFEFIEKPTHSYDVSMGIYFLNKKCLDYVPKGENFGFDQLMEALLESDEKIHAYPHQGFWLDIGRPEDYDRANKEWVNLSE